jgi:hypothetical protein
MKTCLLTIIFLISLSILPGMSVITRADDDPFGIAALKDSIPSSWMPAFDENVQSMGENKQTFIDAFKQLDSNEKKKAAVFLVAYMPLVDLASMTTTAFVHNIDYAFKARAEFPWCKEYNDDMFYHYVLPYRVSQEPIEDFRPFFYEQLKNRLKNATNLAQAAVDVNKYADEMIDYKPTQSRDQGPFETLKSGYGRCEEMMIFYIDAARSVGIPARQAWTPYWAHCDDNHAWTEVWAIGKWGYLGACEYASSLNQAWFSNPAQRAALVMSVPFGLPDRETCKEEIYRYEEKIPDKYAVINSITTYAEPGKLEITVTDRNGDPIADANVFIYVFNYGALRPIARLTADKMGFTKITIGEGRYFVSGGNESMGGGQLVNIKKKKTTKVTIKPSDGPVLDGYNWLRAAKPPK